MYRLNYQSALEFIRCNLQDNQFEFKLRIKDDHIQIKIKQKIKGRLPFTSPMYFLTPSQQQEINDLLLGEQLMRM